MPTHAPSPHERILRQEDADPSEEDGGMQPQDAGPGDRRMQQVFRESLGEPGGDNRGDDPRGQEEKPTVTPSARLRPLSERLMSLRKLESCC